MEGKSKNVPKITSVAEKEIDLLSRHLDVLKTVRDNGPIGIIRLSQITGQPQHMVRYSLRILEQEGLVEPSPQGAVTTDKIKNAMPLLKDKLREMNTTIDEIIKELD